jgi:alpha-1,2-mannosyltransferase
LLQSIFLIVSLTQNKNLGFHATTAADFAAAFEKALTVENPLEMRLRARESAWRFSEGEFARKWIEQTAKLVDMTKH